MKTMNQPPAFNFPSIRRASRTLLLAALTCLACLFSHSAAAAQTELLTDMGLQLQRYSKAVLLADRGRPEGYPQLRASHDRFSTDLELLLKGGKMESCSVPVPSSALRGRLEVLAKNWTIFDNAGMTLLAQQETMRQVRAAVKELNDAEGNMMEYTEQFSILLLQNQGTPLEMMTAAHLKFLHARLIKNANRILFDDMVDPEVAFLFGKDKGTFADVLNGFLNGSKLFRLHAAKGKSKEKLLEISKKFEIEKSAITVILDNLQSVVTVKHATQEAMLFADPLFQNLQAIQNGIPSGDACSIKMKN